MPINLKMVIDLLLESGFIDENEDKRRLILTALVLEDK